MASTSNNAVLGLAREIIACPSITPDDQGAQQIIIQRLEKAGFQCETIILGPEQAPVTNLWAIRQGSKNDGKTLVFAGHTDVVAPGPISEWASDPFTPTERNGKLYGRGAADMKSSIAAFTVACEEFISQLPQHRHNIALLITSDEEGPSIDGTAKICEILQERGQRLDYCIVGEPSSTTRLGDMIKNGRRGSLGGELTVYGIQGHIAYPHLARNPIHLAAPALAELAQIQWDNGNEFFPPTSWQISNIHAGTGASNVIPGNIRIDFNFRFSTESTPASLKDRLVAVLEKHHLDYELKWTLSGMPFLTPVGSLVNAIQESIQAHTGITAELSTSGGTSDGRFIAAICPQVVEFGPVNESIHKVNEHITVADLEPLKNIYLDVLKRLCA